MWFQELSWTALSLTGCTIASLSGALFGALMWISNRLEGFTLQSTWLLVLLVENRHEIEGTTAWVLRGVRV